MKRCIAWNYKGDLSWNRSILTNGINTTRPHTNTSKDIDTPRQNIWQAKIDTKHVRLRSPSTNKHDYKNSPWQTPEPDPCPRLVGPLVGWAATGTANGGNAVALYTPVV